MSENLTKKIRAAFGKKLKEERKRKKMTQAELADFLNLSRDTVFGYEAGNILPSVGVLVQLSIFFGISTDELLGLDELSPRKKDKKYVILTKKQANSIISFLK